MRLGARAAPTPMVGRMVFAPRLPPQMAVQVRRFTPTPTAARGAMTQVFTRPLIDFVLIISRVARITIGSVLAVAAITFGVWEGTHQYVEYSAMRKAARTPAGTDDEYGWVTQASLDLLGSSGNGTDARLGIFGRHLVRSAWIAENWGGGVTPSALFGRDTVDQDVSNHGLVLAENFLTSALSIAESRNISVPESIDIDESTAIDPTAVQLEAWHAAVCERLATRTSLSKAVSLYEKLYDAAIKVRSMSHAAAFATRLGSVHALLGHKDASDSWINRAIYASGTEAVNVILKKGILSEAPLATRSLISTLETQARIQAISATSRSELESALNASVNTARIAHNQEVASTSDSSRLHNIWMQQEEALLSVYIGETLYALQKEKPTLLERLMWKRHPTPSIIGGTSRGAKGVALSVEWLEHARDTAANATASLGDFSSNSSLSVSANHIMLRAKAVQEEAQRLLDLLK
ncbi:hypothetical protein MCUN1_000816 [Malassezia cuniculi]|uniref:Uncharacterized protein n=1 Tax=Malassezia cuniculi TaxID=948313 RepID=A0AAF0J596_9BASI|nr:hypothetical protein MCUN1_000816 [Malassezia cuniculi]